MIRLQRDQPHKETAVRGQVVRTIEGRKFVVRKEEQEIGPQDQIVADEPHGDGDYSYLCGWEYCRCYQ